MDALAAAAGDGAAWDPSLRQRRYLLHPHVIFRFAGLPFATIAEVGSGRTLELVEAIAAADDRIGLVVQRACDYLQTLIGCDEIDNDSRRQLLKLRRDLFNRRETLPELQGEARALIDDVALGDARRAIAELAAMRRELPDVHSAEIADAVVAIYARCFQSEMFLKALAFSAPKCLEDLLAARVEPGKFTGKRGRHLQNTLFNYLLRASTKVSPLTYFTPIAIGRWSEAAPGFDHSLGNRAVLNEVQLSRRVVDRILCALTRTAKFWGEDYPLQLNPTLRRQDELYEFTKIWEQGEGNARVWGAQPPHGRVPASPPVEAVVGLFGGGWVGRAFSIRELYAALGESHFGGDRNRFVRFVVQAMRAGLLLPQLEAYDQEDGLDWLARLTARSMPELSGELKRLTALLPCYGNAPFDQRISVKAEILAVQARCLELVSAEGPHSDRAVLLYEDCRLEGAPFPVSTDAIGTAIADAQRLSNLFPLLDITHMVQSITAAMFVVRHGRDAWVRASEALYELSAQARTFAQKVSPLPLDQQRPVVAQLSPLADTLLKLKNDFFGEIASLLSCGADVELSDELVDRYAAALPEPVTRRPASYTVIGQANGELDGSGARARSFAINRLYSGHSMLASRFVTHLPEAEIALIAEYICRLSGDRMPVELPGVFGFNANLHPRFVDTEILLPGRRPNYRDTEKLSLDDIFIGYDAELDRLTLRHIRLGELAPHYFGFLVLMMLPAAHQYLCRMNVQGLILDLWQDLNYAGKVDPDRVVVLPRVSYRELVVMRRSMFVPAKLLPATGLSETEFFRALHDLVAPLGEGHEFFVRLVAEQDDLIGGDEGVGGIGETTDFKPSYLSFRLPLTVVSLQRRLRRRARTILLQEPLPAIGAGGVDWQGKTHACEIQFEISRTAQHGDSE